MQKELKIEIDNFTFNLIYSESRKRGIPLLLLHGFTGCSRDLSFLAEFIHEDFIIIAPDLPGHGKSFPIENIEDYEIDKICNRLNLLLKTLEFNSAIILGYSMGGRIAYTYASKFPQSVKSLIIESSTPGISDKKEREQRKNSDYALAEKILNGNLSEFVEFWLSQPIFSSLKKIDKRLYEKIYNDKLNNNPIGLANSLKKTGTGSMTPIWEYLENFNFPVLLISGALDKKYSEVNKKAARLLPNVRTKQIGNSGHIPHLENPHEFVKAVTDFINE